MRQKDSYVSPRIVPSLIFLFNFCCLPLLMLHMMKKKKISRKVTVDIYYDAKSIKIKLIMHEQRVNKSQSWKSAKVHREKKKYERNYSFARLSVELKRTWIWTNKKKLNKYNIKLAIYRIRKSAMTQSCYDHLKAQTTVRRRHNTQCVLFIWTYCWLLIVLCTIAIFIPSLLWSRLFFVCITYLCNSTLYFFLFFFYFNIKKVNRVWIQVLFYI